MKKDPIILSTREQLNVYMSPVRQELLRIMSIKSVPMTPKELANRLGISASSVQHHIKKLAQLGAVELDHQEVIRGITASYYRLTDADISFESAETGRYLRDHEALAVGQINQVVNGFFHALNERTGSEESAEHYAHSSIGITHITEEEQLELLSLIRDFIYTHNTPKEGSQPWEFTLVAYRCEETL